MTFLEAAIAVLETANRPLSTRELIEEALRRKLIDTKGKTPAATMQAALYEHIHHTKQPRIERLWVPGRTRATRGSVRWTLQRSPSAYAAPTL